MSKQKAEFDNLEPIALDLGKLGNTVLPGSAEYEYYLDLNDRILYIDFDIDNNLTDYSRRIIRWNREDKDIPVEDFVKFMQNVI